MIQLEFPFTVDGALYKYNKLQREYFIGLYEGHKALQVEPRDVKFSEFLIHNVPIFAPIFSKKYSAEIFTDLVERQNETTLQLWSENDITQRL